MRKFLIFALLAFASTASAGKLGLMPLGGVVQDNQNSHTLTLTNNGSEPMTLQVRTFSWSQVDGKDVLVRTREFMATPERVELPPGAKRIVRLVRIAPATGKAMTYRAIIDELPKPVTATRTGMGMRLNYSLPYIFEPANATAPAIRARWVGKQIEFINDGGRAAKLAVLGPVDGKPWIEGLAGWVLPGSMIRIAVPATASQISVRINNAPQTLSVQ